MKPCLQEQNLTSFSFSVYYRVKALAFCLCFTRFRARIAAVSPIMYEICHLEESSSPCAIVCCQALCYHISSCLWRARYHTVEKIHCPGITQSMPILPFNFIMQECHYSYLLLLESLWNSTFSMLWIGFLNLEDEIVLIFKSAESSIWHSSENNLFAGIFKHLCGCFSGYYLTENCCCKP